jgi:hypothetical protein
MRDDEFLTKLQGSIESHHQQQQSLFENSKNSPWTKPQEETAERLRFSARTA